MAASVFPGGGAGDNRITPSDNIIVKDIEWPKSTAMAPETEAYIAMCKGEDEFPATSLREIVTIGTLLLKKVDGLAQ